MTRKWPVVGLLLAVLWLFVRGVALDPAAVAGEFLVGLAVGLPLAYLFRRFYADQVAVRRSLAVAPYALAYVAVFLREVLTANLDVAYRVLAPSMPIDPDVIAVPLRVETDAAVTTIANSITLTPGTLTMDHDDETNTLYVHAIVGDVDSVVSPIRTWEDYALLIFDEEKRPSDPAPQARGGGPSGARRGTSDERSESDGGEPSGAKRSTSDEQRESDGGEHRE